MKITVKRLLRNGIATIIGLLALVSCTTAPITQRRQLTLIPSAQILSLSQQEYQKVLQDSKLSTDPAATAQLRRVGERIAGAVRDFYAENNMPYQYNWEFNLVQDDSVVNAWCMPGGKIVFYTGILKHTKNEAGMAAVMGHEVAHAIANHGNERMSQSLMQEFGTAMLSKALADKPAQTQALFQAAVGVGTQLGLVLPFSRMQESEADYIGLVLMAKAGYDPNEAIQFWQRMSAGKAAHTPEFLSTHPSDARRIEELKRHIPEAMKHISAAQK